MYGVGKCAIQRVYEGKGALSLLLEAGELRLRDFSDHSGKISLSSETGPPQYSRATSQETVS